MGKMSVGGQGNLTANFNASTAGFTKGVAEIKQTLADLNAQLAKNKEYTKATNDELKMAEKEWKRLNTVIESGLPVSREQRQEYEALTKHIETLKTRVGQFAAEESMLKAQINNTNKELKDQYNTLKEPLPNGQDITNLGRAFSGLADDISGTNTTLAIFKSFLTTGSWVGAMALGINLLVNAVTSYSAAAAEAYEKTVELAGQSLNNAKASRDEAEELDNLIKDYQYLGNKAGATKDEKNRLVEIQKTLNESFDAEANAIDIVNGKYDEQISKLNMLSEGKREISRNAAQAAANDAQKAYDENIKIAGVAFSDPATAKKEAEIINGLDLPGVRVVLPAGIDDAGGRISFNRSFSASDAGEGVEKATRILDALRVAGLETSQTFNHYNEILQKSQVSVDVLSEANSVLADTEKEVSGGVKNLDKTIIKTQKSFSDLTDEIKKSEKELPNLISQTKNVSKAFAEMKDTGTLSVDTITKLIDEGYASCLMFDEETGKVTLNADAYRDLATAMIEAQKAKYALQITELSEQSDSFGSGMDRARYNAQLADINTKTLELEARIEALNVLQSNIDKAVDGTFESGYSQSKKGTAKSGSTSKPGKSEEQILYENYQKYFEFAAKERIKLINEEADAKKKAHDDAIKEINEEIEARKRKNADDDYQNEINQINARLKYEQLDDFSRKELERHKADLVKEQIEVLWQREKADEKTKIKDAYTEEKESYDEYIAQINEAVSSMKIIANDLKSGVVTGSNVVNTNYNHNTTSNPVFNFGNTNLTTDQLVDLFKKAIYDATY